MALNTRSRRVHQWIDRSEVAITARNARQSTSSQFAQVLLLFSHSKRLPFDAAESCFRQSPDNQQFAQWTLPAIETEALEQLWQSQAGNLSANHACQGHGPFAVLHCRTDGCRLAQRMFPAPLLSNIYTRSFIQTVDGTTVKSPSTQCAPSRSHGTVGEIFHG